LKRSDFPRTENQPKFATPRAALRPATLLLLAASSALLVFVGGCTTTPLAGSESTGPVRAAVLEVTPSTISFGSAVVNQPNSQSVKLSNTGTAPVTLTGVVASGAGLAVTGFSGSTMLNPSTSITLGVQLTPKTSGNLSGSVSILSQIAALDMTLPVTADVAAADLAIKVGPASINFGALASGKTATQSVTLSNAGNTELTVSKISLSGSAFSLSGGGAPMQLSSGQSTTVNVEFDPKSAGSYSGALTVDSNAKTSIVVVNLSGSVTAPPTNPPVGAHYVGLAWDASTSASISGYNVYRGASQQGPFAKLNNVLVGGLSYTDDSVNAGDTYYYVTTAVNAQGEESPFSNIAKATIP
jgi:HYDIN/CFA65/VesB family protein